MCPAPQGSSCSRATSLYDAALMGCEGLDALYFIMMNMRRPSLGLTPSNLADQTSLFKRVHWLVDGFDHDCAHCLTACEVNPISVFDDTSRPALSMARNACLQIDSSRNHGLASKVRILPGAPAVYSPVHEAARLNVELEMFS